MRPPELTAIVEHAEERTRTNKKSHQKERLARDIVAAVLTELTGTNATQDAVDTQELYLAAVKRARRTELKTLDMRQFFDAVEFLVASEAAQKWEAKENLKASVTYYRAAADGEAGTA